MEKEIENKFYVPSIEEFHVGFEFEETPFIGGYKLISNPIWHKVIYQITEKAPLSTIESMIHFKHARVKYLDKELIIELGWKLVWTENETLVFRFNDWILTFNDFNKQIIITFGNDSLSRRFNGKLKNKNQLKILMKWLEIL